MLFDWLATAFQSVSVLRNRAITVSTALLAWKIRISTPGEASELATFIDEFVHRLSWQVKKGLDADREYRYLIEFQRNITQASAESSSVAARAKMLEEGFGEWRTSSQLPGDAVCLGRTGLDPSEESR